MDSKDTVYPYPLALEMSTPLNDMIFPTGIAQNTEEIRIIGEEIIAERPVVVVDRFVGEGFRPSRLWVDGQTGMLLKRQDFSKDNSDLLVTEYLVNQVIFDTQFAASLFSTDIDTNPIFKSYDAVPPVDPGEPTISDLPVETNIPGNLYFVVSDQTGTISLVRQSASCVFQSTACPEANPVAGYPNVNGIINPLIWSPTGEKAALVITSNNGEPLDQLYLFDAVENTWEMLASYPSINTPAWSKDGETIYIVANSNQATNVIAVPTTVGMPFINLSEGYFSEENAALTISGWLDNRLFVSHALAGRGLEYLSLSPTMVDVKPVDILPSARYIAVPSPKQNFIAMAGYSEDESMELTIRDIEHGSEKLVGSFANSGISSLLWTPDNQWVIFEINTMLSSNTLTASIYAVRPDGSDLRLLYSNAGGIGWCRLLIRNTCYCKPTLKAPNYICCL